MCGTKRYKLHDEEDSQTTQAANLRYLYSIIIFYETLTEKNKKKTRSLKRSSLSLVGGADGIRTRGLPRDRRAC